MPTYAYPSSTVVRDTPTMATLQSVLNQQDIPQSFRECMLLGYLLNAAKQPGLEIQGTDLQMPSVGVSPKIKRMRGPYAEVFVNFESGVTAQEFRGLQSLSTAIGEGPTTALTPWAYYTCYVAISHTQKIENSGGNKRLDILMSNQNKEIRGLCRRMEGHLWGTNTDIVAGTQNQFAGIGHRIAISPSTGTNEGLSRSTFTPWRNATTTSVGSFASGGLDAMRAMILGISGVNQREKPHLAMTTTTVQGYCYKALEGIHRVVGTLGNTDLGTSGLPVYMGIPIAGTDDCTAGYIYYMNFDYLWSLIHADAEWSEHIPGEPANQLVDGQKRYVFGAAPLMISRLERFGVLSGITA